MASVPFGAFITHHESLQSPSETLSPPRAVHIISPNEHELDEIHFASPSFSASQELKPNGQTSLFPTPNELESNRSRMAEVEVNSKPYGDVVDVVQSLKSPHMNRYRFITTCTIWFCYGLNDSAAGALIPYMEKYYNIGYAMVSLIFVMNALGSIAAASCSNLISLKLGRAKALMVSNLVLILGYSVVVCAPPWPVVVASFFLIGFGFALTATISNVFILNLTNATTLLGIAHGAYGIGGTVGPLIATTLVSNGFRWSVYYFICIGISAFNLFFAGWSFWNFEADTQTSRKNGVITITNPTNSSVAPEIANPPPKSYILFRQALSNRTTLLGSLFIFAYQGAEVSISGWVISFLQAYRISTTSSLSTASIGYVTSGFWAGITLGRFILSHPAQRIGEKRFVFGLTLGAIMFQLVVWFVPNVIGDAVAVGFIGLLLGPIYPCAMSIFSRLLSKDIQMVALGIVSALGCTGGAIAPFSTGLLAQSVGTWVLHPVCVVLFASMMGSWAGLKTETKRRE